MAETYDISVAPHSAIGPLALAACLQVDFAIPNALIQEQGVGYTQPGLDNGGADILDYLVDTSVFELASTATSRARPGRASASRSTRPRSCATPIAARAGCPPGRRTPTARWRRW